MRSGSNILQRVWIRFSDERTCPCHKRRQDCSEATAKTNDYFRKQERLTNKLRVAGWSGHFHAKDPDPPLSFWCDQWLLGSLSLHRLCLHDIPVAIAGNLRFSDSRSSCNWTNCRPRLSGLHHNTPQKVAKCCWPLSQHRSKHQSSCS